MQATKDIDKRRKVCLGMHTFYFNQILVNHYSCQLVTSSPSHSVPFPTCSYHTHTLCSLFPSTPTMSHRMKLVEVERFMSMDSLVEPDSSVFSGMLKYLAQRTLHCLGLIRGKHEPRAFPNMIHNEGVEVLDKQCNQNDSLSIWWLRCYLCNY